MRSLLIQVLFTFIFIIIFFQALSAQKTKRNLIQAKLTVDYFNEYSPSPFSALFYPDISYKRFFKEKQRFIEIEFDNYDISSLFKVKHNNSDIGKSFHKTHYMLANKIGAYLIVTPKITAMAKTGIVFRYGEESNITNVNYYNVGTPLYYSTISLDFYKVHDFGLEISSEFMYQFSKKWYFSLDGGLQRYFNFNYLTRVHFWAGLGTGYKF